MVPSVRDVSWFAVAEFARIQAFSPTHLNSYESSYNKLGTRDSMSARPRKLKKPLRGYDRKPLCAECLEPRLALDSTVVFNEVMYHPAEVDGAGEWIELECRWQN